jgi:dolichol-phosphate mannosyltransferase
VFNESDSLEELHREIRAAGRSIDGGLEIIFVDDGSTDSSWRRIVALQELDPSISALRFRRNFGKAAALAAGFSLARGERVFTLDADLQDDPKEIPKFLAKMDEGYDLVSGWKKVRYDPWHKVLPSRVFNGLVSRLTGVHLHDHNCGFKCYRDEVLDEIQLYGEFHRFTPVLASARGFTVAEVVVDHRPRKHGHSKYGVARILKGLIDLTTIKFLTSFRNRPQHLLGSMGLACFLFGVLGLGYLAAVWIANLGGADYGPIGARPLLIFSATAVLLGAQVLTVGLIAELITARSHDERQVYSVRERRLSPHRTGDRVANREDVP